MGKMLGARVPDKLNETIRNGAKKRGQSVNEFLNDILTKAMDGSPESYKPHIKSTALEIARQIKELKQEIKALQESSQGSFFGLIEDEDVREVCKVLNDEIKHLRHTLTEANKALNEARPEQGNPDDDDELINPMTVLFPWTASSSEEEE